MGQGLERFGPRFCQVHSLCALSAVIHSFIHMYLYTHLSPLPCTPRASRATLGRMGAAVALESRAPPHAPQQRTKRLKETLQGLPKPEGIFVPGRHLGDTCEWFQPTSLLDVLLIMGSKSNVRLQVGNTERRVEKFFKWNHKYLVRCYAEA